MIVIIDYGVGNLNSVLNILKKVGAEAKISSDPLIIRSADKLILPGVGAFDNGMRSLAETGLIEILTLRVLQSGTPILGICLGAQLFTRRSEEGTLPGLGWIDAETVRFPVANNHFKIPHMGWNEIQVKKDNPLLTNFDHAPRFYFVHSYYIRCNNMEDILATSHYGIEFTAAVWHKNIVGTQFHPEKSHKFGLRVLANFARM